MSEKQVTATLQRRVAELEELYPDRRGISAFTLDIVIGLVRAWIHERAMREKAEFMCLILSQPLGTRKSLQNKPQMTWTDADWLATVKERVGWVDDQH